MGQQQLILLVLGVVVVGVAVTIGIQAFAENSKRANLDSLVNDAVGVASAAQAWMLKPGIYGGGNNTCQTTCDWSGATFSSLGLTSSSGGTHVNLNGEITIDGTSSPQQLTVTASNSSYGNQVTVIVTGVEPADITSSIDPDFSS